MPDTVFDRIIDQHIQSHADLRRDVDPPSELVQNKIIDHIDPLAERFIAASPLAILGTRRPDGGVDQTPRGDPAGFLKVLDSKTLAMPDRPGNKRMDAVENILCDPAVGLLVLIPGHRDTLRIGGRAAIVRDATLAEDMAVNGKPAGLITLIQVDFVMSHCPKAFIRSGAWEPDKWPDTSDVPSLAEIVKAHSEAEASIPVLEQLIEDSAKHRLY